MRKMNWAMLAALTIPGTLAAQERARGPQLDALAMKVWDRWEKMEYHPGRAGVKKASVKIKARAAHLISGQKAEGNGAYRWDQTARPPGQLTWGEPAAGPTFARFGWRLSTFDAWYDPRGRAAQLAGARMTGHERKEGGHLLRIHGSRSGLYGFVFSSEGVLTTMVMGSPQRQLPFQMHYVKKDGLYLVSGWSYSMDIGEAKMNSRLTFTHEKIGKFWVFKGVEEKATVGGRPMIEIALDFSDHKIE